MRVFNISVMNEIKKIAGINLAIILASSIVIRLIAGISDGTEKGLGIAIISAVVVAIHVIINILLWVAFMVTNSKRSKAFLISSGIVLLVGFSTCLANASF